MNTMGSEMRIEIPNQLIEDTIRAEMVRSMSANGTTEKWIQAIVREAMEKKKDNYSYSKTLFQEAVSKMIVDEATNIFREWLDENRKQVGIALRKYLTDNKQAALTKMCESLAENINTYGVRITAKFLDIQD